MFTGLALTFCQKIHVIRVLTLPLTVNSSFDVDFAIIQTFAHEVLFEIPESVLIVLHSLIHSVKFPEMRA